MAFVCFAILFVLGRFHITYNEIWSDIPFFFFSSFLYVLSTNILLNLSQFHIFLFLITQSLFSTANMSMGAGPSMQPVATCSEQNKTKPKKCFLFFPSSHWLPMAPQLSGRLWDHLPFYFRIFWLDPGNHSRCKFMGAVAMSCPKHSIS